VGFNHFGTQWADLPTWVTRGITNSHVLLPPFSAWLGRMIDR